MDAADGADGTTGFLVAIYPAVPAASTRLGHRRTALAGSDSTRVPALRLLAPELQAIAFLVSYTTHTVLLPLEIFLGAFVALCLVSHLSPHAPLRLCDLAANTCANAADTQAVGPAWPYLNKHKHRFLPVRSYQAAAGKN